MGIAQGKVKVFKCLNLLYFTAVLRRRNGGPEKSACGSVLRPRRARESPAAAGAFDPPGRDTEDLGARREFREGGGIRSGHPDLCAEPLQRVIERAAPPR